MRGLRFPIRKSRPARPGKDPRQDIVVTGPPDQMRTEGDRSQRGVVAGQDQLLGDRLGRRIGGVVPGRVGDRLVDAFQVLAREDDAGRAGVDQAPTPCCRQAAITVCVPTTLAR